MLTLQQATDALKGAGFINVRMVRSYKRRDHRECLIEGWLPFAVPKGTKAAPAEAARTTYYTSVMQPIRDSLQLTYENFGYDGYRPGLIETTLQCRVQLPEQY